MTLYDIISFLSLYSNLVHLHTSLFRLYSSFDAGRKLPVQVVPPVGELVQPVGMTEDVFLSLQSESERIIVT